MTLDERVSDFIGHVYEGAHDAAEWDRVAADLLTLTDTQFLFISIVDPAGSAFVSAKFHGRFAPRMEQGGAEYLEGMYLSDSTLKFMAAHPAARFCDSRAAFPAAVYLDQPHVRWNNDRFGSTHWLIGFTEPRGGLTFAVSIHPAAADGPMSPRQDRLFKMLFNHMEAAIRLAARPPMLDGETDAVLLLDRRGAVQRMSSAAAAIIAERDGLVLNGRDLEAADRAGTDRLRGAIKSALDALVTGSAGGAVRLSRPSGKADWLVTITPMVRRASPAAALGSHAVARVTCAGDRTRLSPLATALFGLTPREAEVADLIVQGHSLQSLSGTLAISPHTAKVHLHALFAKTGASRQAELVRLLLSHCA